MIYEYECTACGTNLEIRHGILEDPLKMVYCPHCGRMRPARKLISKSSFILKGGAWARDGYAKKVAE